MATYTTNLNEIKSDIESQIVNQKNLIESLITDVDMNTEMFGNIGAKTIKIYAIKEIETLSMLLHKLDAINNLLAT